MPHMFQDLGIQWPDTRSYQIQLVGQAHKYQGEGEFEEHLNDYDRSYSRYVDED